MQCPYKPEIVCSGPTKGRWWVCPVHGAELTGKWTELCRTLSGYFRLWEKGRGPGQIIPGKGSSGKRLSPAERLEKTFREHVLSQRPGYGQDMTFEQALLYLSARPWAAIQKTLTLCLECEHFKRGRCTVHGESCNARTQWMRLILRRSCQRFKPIA